ncbi:MAG: hypothetical protein JSR79_08660 [Proteobacteria bacterium]|nr:hypothetical protein [Pseudomonadota bacterium]
MIAMLREALPAGHRRSAEASIGAAIAIAPRQHGSVATAGIVFAFHFTLPLLLKKKGVGCAERGPKKF